AEDNLFIGNWLDPSGPTVRQGEWDFHFGISTYGSVGPRNHILNNVLNDTLSFRTKFMVKETTLQGNVMLGSCSTVPVTYYALDYKPKDKVIFRSNVLLGRVATDMHAMPPCGPGGNWCDPFKAFVNNFVPDEKNRAQSIEAARFADPAYLDYRLQPGSALKGQALGGGDLGAFRQPHGRIFYMSASGGDGALAKATAALQPGDMLYVMPGAYAEPMVVKPSGSEDRPIFIRAHGKKDVLLPAVAVSGSWVTLEGFTVSAKDGDGVTVTGSHVVLKDCLVRDCRGCGVKATGARAFTVEHCTVVGNGKGLALDAGSVDAVVRDCIFAFNREAAIAGERLASHNCYSVSAQSRHGEGEAPAEPRLRPQNGSAGASPSHAGPSLKSYFGARAEAEIGIVVADPKFVDAAKQDYRLQWDSPAAHLAPYGRPAGARPALPRTPEIEQVAVTGISADSAVLSWRTPKDDTTATVLWREKGQEPWQTLQRRNLGTVHGVGLMGLKPQTA
ncbi:MAG: hypothetical protein FJ279_38865, partial [Planctomycetes bacterium]|nr:hypothetical protein [Planctomycetota bacterium]